MKIKVGDNVIVIAGKDKGKIGLVQATFPKENKLVVEGINIKTIHVKPTQQKPDGGIEKVEKPIDASNVMLNVGNLKDETKAKATKIAYKLEKNKNGRNDKKRVAKATGEEI
ncbi:MAG: 50S ribosomal protein L24 [Candidatus Tyloplasma litorale]|nr:MAG: 50S ribosomal protein L24 [Mycoplasmatales bacterium]